MSDGLSSKPQRLNSLTDLIGRYDCVLFDQFGVLHDGRSAYDGMVDVVQTLSDAGLVLGVLSNSGKRESVNRQRLQQLGFVDRCFAVVASSGEVAWQQLDQQSKAAKPDASTCADRVLYVGRGSDRSAVEGLPVELVEKPEDADLIIIAGSEADSSGRWANLDAYTDWLKPAAARGTPCWCTNPDRWMLGKQGTLVFGAGQIAEQYQRLCAGMDEGPVSVRWVGKPYAAIYDYALQRAGVSASRTVCIGDSLEHDVVGAQQVGCDSVLVSTGILQGLDESALQALYAEHKAVPTYRLPAPSQQLEAN